MEEEEEANTAAAVARMPSAKTLAVGAERDAAPQALIVTIAIIIAIISRAHTYGDLYYLGFVLVTSGFFALPAVLPDDEKMLTLIVAVTSCLYGITAAVIATSILLDRFIAYTDGSCAAARTPAYFCQWNVAFWFCIVSVATMATESCWGALRFTPDRAAVRYWRASPAPLVNLFLFEKFETQDGVREVRKLSLSVKRN